MTLRSQLTGLFLMVSMAAGAQDKIYKKDGSIVNAKVNEVGRSTITYKKSGNADGPEYTIVKKDVTKIVYENGTSDEFTGRSSKPFGRSADGGHKPYTKRFGDNILTATPGSYTKALDESINDVGIGLTYERLLDDKGHIGLVMPVLLNFASNKNFNNYYTYTSSYIYTGTNDYTSLTFMPGIKLYPAKSNEAVRYSIGCSFFATFGSEPYYVYDIGSYGAPTPPGGGDWNYTMYGAMISNAVNVTVNRHLYMEFDLNAGVPFADNRRMNVDNFDMFVSPFIQFSLKMGGRF